MAAEVEVHGHPPATTHTGSQVAENAPHHPGFPPFQTSTYGGQLLWFAISFGLLYLVLSKAGLPGIAKTLEDRRRRIAQDLDQAHAMRSESEAAGAAYERSLTEARNKAKTIAQTARDQLTAESEARRKSVEADLAAKLSAAEVTIKQRTDEAMSNVRTIAADAASAIVERLTGRPADGRRIEAALDSTFKA